MTNVSSTPEKVAMRERLFEIGIETLSQQGWNVERIPGFGKSSVRRISKGGRNRKVSIRTSQDTWIAFPRNDKDDCWETLSEVDVVLAVSVDNKEKPKFAQVHMVEADEMRRRFDRAYEARRAAGYAIHLGRGLWISLYHPDATDPVTHVGAGAGLDHPPIARIPLGPPPPTKSCSDISAATRDEEPLSISEAKRRLAMTLGVDPSGIKITVEG